MERAIGRRVGRPKDWDAAVSCAAFRALGLTQGQAGEIAGVAARTLRRWERQPWWPEAEVEAKVRFLEGLDARVKHLLQLKITRMLELVEVDPDADVNWDFLKWWLERREPELAPPPRQIRQTVDMTTQFFVGSAPTGFLRNPEEATEAMEAEVVEDQEEDPLPLPPPSPPRRARDPNSPFGPRVDGDDA